MIKPEMDDRAVVAIQMGRQPRSTVEVGARCHFELPIVIDVPPILDDGTPFPTTYWLTCPLARLRISRIESDGGVSAADALIAADPELGDAFRAAMERYATHRDSLMPDGWEGPRPGGGIAGSQGGVKCLHAQYADTISANLNPIGANVAVTIEPLDCTAPCVILSSAGVARNEAWVEPS